jgi:hypothetical protein
MLASAANSLSSPFVPAVSPVHSRTKGYPMRVFIAAAIVAIFALTAPASADEAKQDFKLINKTGYELKALYVSPSKSDDWQDDVLGQAVLGDGQFANVHFSPKVSVCKFDLKVVYSDDDSSAVWSNIDLCTVEKITIHYNREKDETRATFD